nr:unnamed protein product [Callosobruchus analis]
MLSDDSSEKYLITLKKVCPTRWSSRNDALLAVKAFFLLIMKTLYQLNLISNKKDEREECKSIINIFESFDFLVLFTLFSSLFEIINPVSTALQHENNDLQESILCQIPQLQLAMTETKRRPPELVQNLLKFDSYVTNNFVTLVNKHLPCMNSLKMHYQALEKWFNANRLQLNVNKTENIIFSLRPVNQDLDLGESVKTDFVRFLGVHLDNTLVFDTHIDQVSCHGIPWFAFWIAFTWLFNNPHLVQMQANMLLGSMINILMAKIEKLTDLCTGSLAQMNLRTAKAEENTKKYIDEQIANLQKSINTISRVSIPEPTEPGTSNSNKTSTLQRPQGKPVTAQQSQQKQVTQSNLFDKQRNLANYYVNLNKDIGDHNKPENINYQQKQDQRKTLNNYYCIIHQNVQSLGNSVDKINLVLQEHPLCKVLCVTEHWKSEEQLQQIGIQGFKLASSFCREEGHHGGAAVYVEKNVMFQENRNLNKISVIGEFECAVVEYKIGNRHFVCCAIYRPPSGDRRIFFLKLEELLTHLNQTKIIIITGDFNIEMFYENNLKSELYSLMYSFSLKPKINGFTRVTSHSQSGLDNIFTNHINCTAEVLETHISDHSAQKMVVPLESIYDNRVFYTRFFTDNAKSNFQNELKQQDWQEVFEVSEQNVNLQWKLFISNFINIFNMCFPRRRIYPKQYKIKYKTNEKIQECKNRLDKLLVLYRHNKLFKFDYDNTKKEYDRLIIEQRKKDMESKIYNSDNKLKAMWVICNEIRGHVGNDDECKIPGDPYEVANKVSSWTCERFVRSSALFIDRQTGVSTISWQLPCGLAGLLSMRT